MNEQEIQKAFIQFLAQKSGAKTEQDLQSYIQQLGQEGLKQAYQEFMQVMQQQQQQQQPRMARHGAKLNYIKRLAGEPCKEGEKAVYYKVGGKFCKKCEAQKKKPTCKVKQSQTGSKIVQEFKESMRNK